MAWVRRLGFFRLGLDMHTIGSADAILHPALEGVSTQLTALEEAELTDRRRLAVVLQAASLLAHLEHGGWHLPRGWEGAAVDREGFLRLPRAAPGPEAEMPQVLLSRLLRGLFGVRDEIAGRGEARRAARVLLEDWGQELVPLPPDRAVVQILHTAPFLWESSFAEIRGALAAEHRRNGRRELWLAGPGRWRSRVLALAADRNELEAVAAGEVGRELWEALENGAGEAAGSGGHRHEPERDGDSGAADPRVKADALFRQGRFEKALDELQGMPFERCGLLRVGCHYLLGQLGSARAGLRRLAAGELSRFRTVVAAEVAQRVLMASGDPAGAQAWVARALAAGSQQDDALRLRAVVLAATAAWDRGEPEAMDRHLEVSREARENPEVAWRWHHAAALRALAASDGAGAVEQLTRALGRHRRPLHRFEAAALWNDLGLARAQTGDLAGAERAFLHALRLQERCDGPRKLTLALENLAEIRLRRGRVLGVREILERATAANRRSRNQRGVIYDTALWARFELALGRPETALDLCRQALSEADRQGWDGYRPELQVLAARALGWLGRSEQAAESLAETTSEAQAELEPEEIAPLWAHAGEREEALRLAVEGAAESPTSPIWQRVLSARPVPPEMWKILDGLEPFRAARVIFDCDLLAPGSVPAHYLRRAVAVFRRLGAGLFAERLEARDTGPWGALAAYLVKPPGGAALEELFHQAGYGQARVWWESEDDSRTVVEGPGGAQELEAALEHGRLVLAAPFIDAPLGALFRLVLRDFVPRRAAAARPPKGGMVGESEALLTALERIERLAASELPVLVLGESGTGKELAARQIHRRSRRSDALFLPFNCAAVSETLLMSELFGHVRGAFTGADRDRAGPFEAAQGGTVFLDEIGDLPAVAQGMLLRVLQEGEVRRVGETLARRVDVRVVAATHQNLEAMVQEGRFREDLFYRLRGARVTLPPLRDRGRDVLLLADHLLAKQLLERQGLDRGRAQGDEPGGRPRLSAAAEARLLAYDWPGNVRELDNVLGSALALAAGETLEPEHLDLPEEPGAGVSNLESSYQSQVDALRRRLVREAMAATGNHRAAAARRLGLTRQALSYLINTLGITFD